MPRQYLAIRDKFLREGKPEAEAKERAAKIFNSKHPGNPVGPHSDSKYSVTRAALAAAPKVTLVSPSFDLSAPKKLVDLYQQHLYEHLDAGHEEAEARRRALRMVQHAGWYKTRQGWKQVHPDLRDKVNIREAVKQPDGRYFIEGVPIFYPNAVKPGLEFNAKHNRQIIENTNRMIASGSQKPGLIEGHTNMAQAALGVQPDVHGFAVNLREDPKKKGWMLCDLVDVDPEYVQRMQTLKLTGLSPFFVDDAEGLNRRLGHVALLGGSPQALSQLPATELFSANESSYLCFSADSSIFNRRQTMPGINLTPAQQSAFDSMQSSLAAFASAKSGLKVGEPGSENKLAEAFAACCDSVNKFNAAFAGAPMPMPTMHGDEEPKNAQYEAEGVQPGEEHHPAPEGTAAAKPEGLHPDGDSETSHDQHLGHKPQSELPTKTSEKGFSASQTTADFVADPAGAFAAQAERLHRLTEENGRMAQLVQVLNSKLNIMTGREAKMKFDAEVNKLRKEGRTIPQKLADANFEMCFSAKDPQAALSRVLATFAELPKAATPATAGRVLTPAEAAANVARIPAATLPPQRDAFGVAFSAAHTDQDKAFEAIGAAITGQQ